MDEEYAEAVLGLVERVPPGRAVTYGALADAVGSRLRRGGPRQVARVMATHGGGVPWWRVVTAAGRLPPGHEVAARRALAAEGCPLTADGTHVDLRLAGWWPADGPDPERPDDVSGPSA